MGPADTKLTEADFFVAGGTLPLHSGSYLERAADSAILKALASGRFCYVLNSRQMGKSSLCVQTMARLEEMKIRCSFIDLTKIGGRNVTPEQWYAGLAMEACRTLGLQAQVRQYWKEESHTSPMQRFFGAMREVVLANVSEKVVVFVDEIDSTRSLSFDTDEFFAGVRECFNRRVREPEFERLTFCFLGVAVPSDLIHDARTTPFNIGERIYLRDFTLEELAPLELHLGPNGEKVLRRVYHWTRGHPFLTQSICRALSSASRDISGRDVDELIERDLLEPRVRETNINLSDVGNRVLNGYADGEDVAKFRADILSAYGRSLSGKEVLQDDESNRITAVLKLSGLMRSDGKSLQVRNRIYERAFDRKWIAENMPGQELRRQKRAFILGALRTGLVSLVVVALIAGLAINNFKLARQEAQQRDVARYETYVADLNLMLEAYNDNDLIHLSQLLQATKNSPSRNMEWDYWNAKLHDANYEFDLPRKAGYSRVSTDGKTIAVWDANSKTGSILKYPDLSLLHTLHLGRDKFFLNINGKWFTGNQTTITRLDINDAITDALKGSVSLAVCGPGTFGGGALSQHGNAYATSWEASGDHYAQDAYVWSTRTYRLLHHFTVKGKRIYQLSISDDGRFLADEEVDSESPTLIDNYYGGRHIVVRDLSSGTVIDSFPTGGVPTGFRLSDDGKFLGVALDNAPTLRVRDVRAQRFCLETVRPGVFAITFSADDRKMLTVGSDLAACIYDMASGRIAEERKGAMSASMPDDARSIAVSGGGTRVYTTGGVDKDSITVPFTYADALGINSRGLLVVNTGHALRFLDPDTFKPVRPNARLVSFATPTSVDANWRMQILRSGSEDGLAPLAKQSQVDRRRGSQGSSLDDKVGRAQVVDTESGKVLCQLNDWSPLTTGMDVDATHVVLLDRTFRVVVLYDRSGKQLWRYEIKNVGGACCRLSPDGQTVAVGLGSGEICMLDVQTGKLRRKFAAMAMPVNDVVFSHDGRKLAVGGADFDVPVFDLASPDQPAVVCVGHHASILSLRFSPDDTRLGTASRDGTARLWDPATGKQMLQIEVGQVAADTIVFDPNGQRFYVSSAAGTIRLCRTQRTSP